MAQAMIFPHQLEINFWRDADKHFLAIWLIIFVLLNGAMIPFASRPNTGMSAAQLNKYRENLYRVKIEIPKTIPKPVASKGAAAVVVDVKPVDVDVAPTKTTGPVSQVDVKARRQDLRNKQAAQDAADDQRRAIASAAVIGGPTFVSMRNKGTNTKRRSSGVSVGMGSGGGSGGLSLSKTSGIVGDAAVAAGVMKAQAGGGISDEVFDSGRITLGEALRSMSGEQKIAFGTAKVELNRSSVKTVGAGPGLKKAQRSADAITNMASAQQQNIQFCYYRMKRKDSALKGKITVEFIIDWNGKVTGARIVKPTWSNPALGKEAETCIIGIVKGWRFEPIDKTDGTVTGSAIYSF